MSYEPSPSWWQGAAIYQIYPLSFADSNGDGWGDLAGVLTHLDYVASLGVDAVWLSPFFRSPMRDFGYDVADHTAVDPIFGTIEDADAVIARAHELGLKIILDQVWSHTSDQHAWFKESAASRTNDKADWYVWADPLPDGMPPNNWLSVFGGSAWTWEPRRRQSYLHHFLTSQPKLNLRNPATLDAILATGRFWLERGVDGFRLDAIDFMAHDPLLRNNPPLPPADGTIPTKPFALQRHDHDMLHPDALAIMDRIRALIDEYPATVTLGEVSSQPAAFDRIADYTRPGRLHLAYTLRLLRSGVSASILEATLAEATDAIEAHGLCWAFGNHDVVRLASRWAGSDPAAERAFMTLLAGPDLPLPGRRTGLARGAVGPRPAARPVRHRLLARVPWPRRWPNPDAMAGGRRLGRLHDGNALAAGPRRPPGARRRSPGAGPGKLARPLAAIPPGPQGDAGPAARRYRRGAPQRRSAELRAASGQRASALRLQPVGRTGAFRIFRRFRRRDRSFAPRLGYDGHDRWSCDPPDRRLRGFRPADRFTEKCGTFRTFSGNVSWQRLVCHGNCG